MTEIKAYEHTCLRCGTVWRSLNERPKVCVHCKSRVYMTPSSRPKQPIADANEQLDTPAKQE